VEDDVSFAPMLMDLAHKKGFKAIIAARGDRALAMARDMKPDAITLDIRLPDMAGWLVLSRLKYDPNTRHIPVHVISMDEDYRRGLALGADSYLEKSPDEGALQETFDRIISSVKASLGHLLLADPNEVRMAETVALIGEGPDIFTTTVTSGESLLDVLSGRDFDCIVISPNLPDIGMSELLSRIKQQGGHEHLPIVIYTGGELTALQETELKRECEDSVVKIVRTSERLLEETAVFLNRREEDLSDRQRSVINQSRRKDRMLYGGKVLIIDDDVRNIFALTSGLERHKLRVLNAESGQAGIELLKSNPDIDVVLMDIMMPEMDGYETTKAIREIPKFRNLPIIALTAKAMKGDREKCISAGASDYIPKPVILEELVSLLRVWLPQTHEHIATETLQSDE
jgi:CheY-like chemotaxis protein